MRNVRTRNNAYLRNILGTSIFVDHDKTTKLLTKKQFCHSNQRHNNVRHSEWAKEREREQFHVFTYKAPHEHDSRIHDVVGM